MHNAELCLESVWVSVSLHQDQEPSIFLCVICLGYSIHDRTIEKQIDEEEIPIEGIPV